MATRSVSIIAQKPTLAYAGVDTYQWTGLTNATTDVGEAIDVPGYADRSVQVTGTFGTGGSVRIEGSIDGTNYAVLTDPQGNALDVTAAKIEAISENVRLLRPRITAGDGTTSLAVTILCRKG
jgi:hypothetical protein